MGFSRQLSHSMFLLMILNKQGFTFVLQIRGRIWLKLSLGLCKCRGTHKKNSMVTVGFKNRK